MSLPSGSAEISPENPTANIALGQPRAIPVFQRLWIDFSSTEPTPLAAAVEAAGAHLDEVLGELLALPKDPVEPDWNTAPLSALVDHIVSTHHAFTKNAMPAIWKLLGELLRKDVNRDQRPELHEIGKMVAPLFTELDQHLLKEEQILFPHIRRMEEDDEARRNPPESPMQVMEEEHDHACEAILKLRELTNDFRPPENATETQRSLYAGLAELCRDLRLHIHLENNVLHARVRGLLDS